MGSSPARFSPCSLALVWPCRLALAAPSASPPAAEQPLSPGFVTIDRADDRTHVGLGVARVSMSGGSYHPVRFELYGQYAARALGAYASLPWSYASGYAGSIDFEGPGEPGHWALGNTDIGAFYVSRAGGAGLALRAGAILPTGADEYPEKHLNWFTRFVRVTDIAASVPGATWLRLSASPYRTGHRVFARADVGVDVALAGEADDLPFSAARGLPKPVVRLNGGLGVDARPVVVAAEAAIACSSDDFKSLLIALTPTVRVRLGPVQPYVAAIFPMPLEERLLYRRWSWALLFGLEWVPDRRL